MNGSNDNEKLIDELANLFNEKAEAHHKAFAATEGEDPDWALWPRASSRSSIQVCHGSWRLCSTDWDIILDKGK